MITKVSEVTKTEAPVVKQRWQIHQKITKEGSVTFCVIDTKKENPFVDMDSCPSRVYAERLCSVRNSF